MNQAVCNKWVVLARPVEKDHGWLDQHYGVWLHLIIRQPVDEECLQNETPVVSVGLLLNEVSNHDITFEDIGFEDYFVGWVHIYDHEANDIDNLRF